MNKVKFKQLKTKKEISQSDINALEPGTIIKTVGTFNGEEIYYMVTDSVDSDLDTKCLNLNTGCSVTWYDKDIPDGEHCIFFVGTNVQIVIKA